jgi:hypothetical protein
VDITATMNGTNRTGSTRFIRFLLCLGASEENPLPEGSRTTTLCFALSRAATALSSGPMA